MDFAPDVTPRAKIYYRAAGLEHVMQFRGNPGESMLSTTARADAAFAALKTGLHTLIVDDFTILRGGYIAQNSNLEFPYTPAAVTPGAAIKSGFSVQDKISHLTFQGRTTGGARSSVKLYGTQWSPDVTTPTILADFKLQAAESAPVAAAISGLQSVNLHGIDGLTITWYLYVTLKVNDKWLRVARKGGISAG